MKEYQLTVSEASEDQEWDAFLLDTPGGHHVQTSCWGRVKARIGWQATRICARNAGAIVGGAQILSRSFPVVGKVAYVTNGPVISPHDLELAVILLDKIKAVCTRDRCELLAIQPPTTGVGLVGMLEASSFSLSTLNLGPTASLILDLSAGPESILANMEHKTRQHVRRSGRSGVVVREGNHSELDVFYPFYLATAKRQGFTPYRREYFDALWQLFAPQGWIVLLTACFEGNPISSQMLIPFGDTVLCKMIGWSGEHSDQRPNHALYWASLQWSIQHGYRYFDFGGVDPVGGRQVLDGKKSSEVAGHDQDIMKYGFGGKVVMYPPAFDFLPNKMFNWVYRHVAPIITEETFPYRFIEYLQKR